MFFSLSSAVGCRPRHGTSARTARWLLLGCSVLPVWVSACSLELAGSGSVVVVDVVVDAEPEMIPPSGQDAATAAPGNDSATDLDTDVPDANADTETGTTGAPDASTEGPPVPAGCALEGRFALRIAFDVTWVGTEFASIVPVIAEGRGELTILSLLQLTSVPGGFAVDVRQCAASVPEFAASITRERYQTRFEDMTWDALSMPVHTTKLSTSCRDPGCALHGEPAVALIGAKLPTPMAAWPQEASGGDWPDDDGDKGPGIAAHMLGPSEGPYDYPPLDLLSSRRMRDLMLGLRTVVGLEGKLESCDAFAGETRESSIHTRAVGCRAVSFPYACGTSDLRFLNDNLPVWTVQAGTFQAKRVAAEAECKDVRLLFAPPPR